MYKEVLQFKALVDSLYSHRDPLKPREALYGGRTNAIKLYNVTHGHEQIEYIDICSLYPLICKHGIFPVGHPKLYTKEEIDLSQIRDYQGLIKCQILPPTDVYLPILPYRCNGKLLFPLCGACAEQCYKDACGDDEQQRALVGTWVTLELFAALDRGYRLLDVCEIWYFPESSQYDRVSGEKGLFGGYMDTFLKIKQEASGFPEGCEDQEKYINGFYDAEGVNCIP